MDAEVPYTTLKPKSQLVRGHVAYRRSCARDRPDRKIRPFRSRLKPWLPTAEPAETRVRRHVAGPMKKASPHFDGESERRPYQPFLIRL